ncbi:MAG: hypothetical protein [Bacteriophage sp.]|nr:MAG: hypothetical protein [Bacteriophage sp.]
MKIKLTLEEAKILLNCIYGTQCVANTYPDMCMNKPEEPTVLSDEEVHNSIVKMCMQNKVNLYINEVLTYTTDRPNYDMIAEELYPYDGEIVSIMNSKKGNNWYINTL